MGVKISFPKRQLKKKRGKTSRQTRDAGVKGT